MIGIRKNVKPKIKLKFVNSIEKLRNFFVQINSLIVLQKNLKRKSSGFMRATQPTRDSEWQEIHKLKLLIG